MSNTKKIVLAISITLLVWFVVFLVRVNYYLPTLPKNTSFTPVDRLQIDTNFYVSNNNWLLKNGNGIWEMYVEGSPLERGSAIGVLSKELIVKQEVAFVEQIENMIPSKFLMHFLRIGTGIYNRKMGEYIPEENKEEIYAISQYASPEFNWIGNNYQRIMNYHSAHDIGHAVQVMGFVGCSTLGVWDDKTEDGSLLMGRNFDFYVGDKFSEDKILLFINPDQGYKHALVTWGGMIGVVSGMNEKGVAIILNAAPTDIPFSSATPVSILAREILQYAENIDDAIAIANKRQTFVAEQFIIGSAADNKMVAIEKTPSSQAVYSPNTPYTICANHFQSTELSQQEEGEKRASGYRYKRMQQLVDSFDVFTPHTMVDFLRDKKGINNADIGLANEKSIDQLIAHHSIIFHPKTKTLWLSTSPFQEGEYLAYNLDSIFASLDIPTSKGLSISKLTIGADTSFLNNQYQNFATYKKLIGAQPQQATQPEAIAELIAANPNYYYTYQFIADCFYKQNNFMQAKSYYEMALQKEISNLSECESIEGRIAKCNKKLK